MKYFILKNNNINLLNKPKFPIFEDDEEINWKDLENN